MPDITPVKLAAYDAGWAALFAEESCRLLAALAPLAVRIEHVGSTAVRGLDAKPIIDIMLGVERLVDLEPQRSRIEALGYEYVPEFEVQIPERRFFRKPKAGERTHHLHAVPVGSDFWIKHLTFRDHLRSNDKSAGEYAGLKRRLVAEFSQDREGYSRAKSEFIEAVLARVQEGERS